ncbi:hypothetical protein [Bacillus alkalicellulosilyticus]|uniref:hypothetical protein n=1 Tax=Alkalihalobacterium alkalicellulosilyticum TaxID=1912214 RepID=UPI000997ED00|nr:hypothetical protein [Bacillus alkalicellulosilyticus]
MSNIVRFTLLGLSVLLLTGCLYPNEQRLENQVPYPDQIQSVQQAVNQFQADTGVLPIKEREMDTPIYQKYPIDFGKLVPRYLQNPPGNSFENGGIFQYVLVDVEEAPTVKLIDLTVMNQIRDVQSTLNRYMRFNDLAPIDEMVDTGLFILDFTALGYNEPPRVQTPYFGNYLPLLIDNQGQVLIDYSMDLNMALQQFEHNYAYGDDIRTILVENSFFVPVFSIPYTVDDETGEPAYFMNRVFGRE